MSMSDVARAIDVSPSMISQIERGQALPSVATLFSLAGALGATVDVFFQEGEGDGENAGRENESPTGSASAPPTRERFGPPLDEDATWKHRYLVPADRRAKIDIRGGIRWERLTPNPIDGFEFLELVYEPHAESDTQLYRHPGMEFVAVQSGTLDVYIGFEKFRLGAGDSVRFESSTPHRYVNPGEVEARALTVIVGEEIHHLLMPGGSPTPSPSSGH